METEFDPDAMVALAKEKGLPFVLDHMGYDGLANIANGLTVNRIEQMKTLVTLVRIGFLVRVDGERGTPDVVRDPEARKLLMTILQASNADEACLDILRGKADV